MSKTRKTAIKRARALPKSTKIRIGKFYAKNQDFTFDELAVRFQCTYQQARRAAHEYASGALNGPKYRTRRAVQALALQKPAEDVLQEQYHVCAAQLAAQTDIPLSERVSLMDRLVSVKKQLQNMRLQSHMRRADASVIMVMVRRFKPEWTEDQIIAFYSECREEAAIQ